MEEKVTLKEVIDSYSKDELETVIKKWKDLQFLERIDEKDIAPLAVIYEEIARYCLLIGIENDFASISIFAVARKVYLNLLDKFIIDDYIANFVSPESVRFVDTYIKNTKGYTPLDVEANCCVEMIEMLTDAMLNGKDFRKMAKEQEKKFLPKNDD